MSYMVCHLRLQLSSAMNLLILYACICCSLIHQAIALNQNYDHSAYLDATEKYLLSWTVDRQAEKIKFAVSVKTTGYVGFGISKGLTGKMIGADIVIGWVDSSGKAHIKDFHGIGKTLPMLDKHQNYMLLKGEEGNGATTLHFERALDTCDVDHDHRITEGTVKVIWSYSTLDPPDNSESSLAYHGTQRGARSLNLLNYVKSSRPPADAKFFDLLMPNVLIPNYDTTYYCMSYEIPDFGGRRHVIEIAPVVQKGNEGVVHHIVVYECSQSFPEEHLNKSGACENPAMPVDFRKCKRGTIAYGWAVGGMSFKFPNHVGMSVGGPGDMKYVIMEMHYDNPQLISGIQDNSGLRFYYTEKLRKYDAGMMSTGQVTYRGFLIPPMKKDWVTVGYCTSGVTKKPGYIQSNFTNNSFQIFGALAHAHLTGRALWLKHIKEDGTEYPEIFRDDNYDFNFQQTNLLTEERTFTPGDALNVYCTFDTTGRTTATNGGESTREEMCLFFLLYYPKQPNFSRCTSYFNEVEDEFTKKYAKMSSTSMTYTWEGVQWNKTMEDELQDIYKGKRVNVVVSNLHSNKKFSGMPVTEITKSHFASSKVCSVSGTSGIKAYCLLLECLVALLITQFIIIRHV